MSTEDAKERDGFLQINNLLLEYGLVDKPIDLSTLEKRQSKPLSDVLHALIAQRQRDADLRQDLIGRNRTLESALERTKKLWQEDGDKCAEAERRLEGAKSSASTAQRQLEEASSTLKKTRDELHRTRKDLLAVKQQAVQQRNANERQIERLRTRFTEEAVKSLRTNSPQVELATNSSTLAKGKESRDASAIHLMTRLARKQIDDLEQRRRELTNENVVLKGLTADCLNLARTAGLHLDDISRESDEQGTESASASSRPLKIFSTLTQHDLFPAGDIAAVDAAMKAIAETSDSIAKNIDRLRQGRSDRLWSKGQAIRHQLRESVIKPLHAAVERPSIPAAADQDDLAKKAIAEAEELRSMLDRAIDKIEDLEDQIRLQKKEVERLADDAKHSASQQALEEATSEVERQRARYQSLCRALEEQERALVQERQSLQRQQEELALEHSLLATDVSLSAQDIGDATEAANGVASVSGDESNSSNVTMTSVQRHPQSKLIPQRFASTPRTRILPTLSNAAAARASTSTAPATKRALTDEKENAHAAPTVAAGDGPTDAKRQRIASNNSEKTGTQVIGGTEMRFITMRKNRGGR